VEIGEEIVQILLGEVTAHGRHYAVAADDGGADAVIVGGRAGGQVLLLEDAAQRWAVERLADAVGVALAAGLLEDRIAASLLRVELLERRGRGELLATDEGHKCQATEGECCSDVPHRSIVAPAPVRVLR